MAGNTDFQSPGFGGGISCENSSPLLLGNTIRENRAFGASGLDSNLGGGIFCSYSSPIISNNIITGNQVDTLGFGGGISCYGSSSPLIANNIIVENVCETVYGGGGGVYSSESSPILSNNVITGNRDVGLLCVYSSIFIINTIIWRNLLGEIVVIEPPVITVNYSDIEGGWEGEGNIDADPFFVSFRGFDYLLRKGSPCIDAGDPAMEDGGEWPVWYNNGPRADMGAYGGPGNVGWLRH
jgi:hypothetical protein